MFNAKAMLEKGVAQNQVANKLRIFYNKDAFFASLRRTTLPAIGNIIQQLGRIDYETKTGQASSRVAIEKLVLSLSLARR
jgi:DNA polymerase III delta subunit